MKPESNHAMWYGSVTHWLEKGIDFTYSQERLVNNESKTMLRFYHVSMKPISKIESPLEKILRKKEA